MTILRLMHGTSTKCLEGIMHDRAFNRRVFLTDCNESADYYAECASEEDGSDPVVLLVEVHGYLLRPDDASFCEPLSFTKRKRGYSSDAEWNSAFIDGKLPYPENDEDFATSLQVVNGALCLAMLPASSILFKADSAQDLTPHIITIQAA